MQMLYYSESYTVVQLDWAAAEGRPGRGGYEIVDQFARQEIFIEGAVAESFKAGVQALMQSEPTQEDVEAFIERYTELGRQPLALH